MEFALSSRWNVRRHRRGEDLVDEILGLGIRQIEMSYDCTRDILPGVRRKVEEGAVRVTSVHNFCPVPMGVPKGHPELFLFSDPDPDRREKAVRFTADSLRTAASLGAKTVVVHGGYVRMMNLSRRLLRLEAAGRAGGWWYRVNWNALDRRRERKAPRHLGWIEEGLTKLMPVIEETGVVLALENLPSAEAVPNELELDRLIRAFGANRLGYWHDFGHGQIRQNLGILNHLRMLERMAPHLRGFHVHDLTPPDQDHVPPPEGCLNFAEFRHLVQGGLPLVLELERTATAEQIIRAREFLEQTWGGPPPAAG